MFKPLRCFFRPRTLFPAAVILCLVTAAAAGPLTFSTFVTQSDIGSLLGNNEAIGFTFAGNKFVGSVFSGGGGNWMQLYSTDLTGKSLAKFGSPLTGETVGEIFVASSLGLGGFPSRDVYAAYNNSIAHFTNSGSSQSVFTTLPSCVCGVRGILFDNVGTWGNQMLVSTTTGQIFRVTSAGVATQIANYGEDTEGLSIAPIGFGPYAGYLLVGSEGSGNIRAINPTTLASTLIVNVPSAEMLNSIPFSLGTGSLLGLYEANYSVNVQFAGISEFSGLQNSLVVSGEFTHLYTDVRWNGSGFTLTTIGTFPDQPEDGIFLDNSILRPVPEPSTLLMVGTALAGVVGMLRRKLSR